MPLVVTEQRRTLLLSETLRERDIVSQRSAASQREVRTTPTRLRITISLFILLDEGTLLTLSNSKSVAIISQKIYL